MKSALLRLREAKSSISPTEQKIAEYMLQHPEDVIDMSIHELAKRTYSSPSTIIRMCRRVGFEGFKEFRKAITTELALRKESRESYQEEITWSDSLEDIVEKVAYRNIMTLENTKNLMDTQILGQCVELVRNARMIMLFGMGASLCAAKDAYLKFLRLNKPCVINEDWHSQLLQARNANSDDVGIVFSYSGVTQEVIECMKAMRENGAKIIAITRCVPSPVSDLADYKLYTTADEAVFRSGAMASRISQLTVLDILYTAYTNSEYDYCVDQISRTHIGKPIPDKYDSGN